MEGQGNVKERLLGLRLEESLRPRTEEEGLGQSSGDPGKAERVSVCVLARREMSGRGDSVGPGRQRGERTGF